MDKYETLTTPKTEKANSSTRVRKFDLGLQIPFTNEEYFEGFDDMLNKICPVIKNIFDGEKSFIDRSFGEVDSLGIG
jgi:hypothetical protein